MRRTLKALLAVAALAAGSALAHEAGSARAKGIVESVTPERVVIKTSDGHAVSFAVTPETRFYAGEKAAHAEDVRVGARAVVQGARKGDALTAVSIKVAPPAR